MDQKIIIGFTGLMASGKDAAKNYLEKKYQAKSLKFSGIMRDVLKRINIEMTRHNLSAVSLCLRETFGEDLFAKVIANDAKESNNKMVVIDGVRRLADITHLTKLEGFYLISIEASAELRHQRLVSRAENVGESEKTFEQFISDHQTETELTIPEVMSKANFVIDNNGDLNNLHNQIDKILEKIQNS